MINVVVMGSTGSIGQQALSVMNLHPDKYNVIGLAADKKWFVLRDQIRAFSPQYVYVHDPESATCLRSELCGSPTQILSYDDFIHFLQSPDVDYLVAAVVGIAGLHSTYAAVQAGKTVLLANKESLVVAGQLITNTAEQSGARLIPVDSEHSALFQCLCAKNKETSSVDVKRFVLTASGGPFWPRTFRELADVTPEQVCAHPLWSMGKKISVDSATMVNKAFEVIEAHWLFHMRSEQIDVVIHPEGAVHSFVDYTDGSTLAHLSPPDMRTALSYALSCPQRMASGVSNVDLLAMGSLSFHALDLKSFPCFQLVRDTLDQGEGYAVIANAANEVAVRSFLENRIRFTEIFSVICETLNRISARSCMTLEAILSLDKEARSYAVMLLGKERSSRSVVVDRFSKVVG